MVTLMTIENLVAILQNIWLPSVLHGRMTISYHYHGSAWSSIVVFYFSNSLVLISTKYFSKSYFMISLWILN